MPVTSAYQLPLFASKACRGCGLLKDPSAFHRNPSAKDGLYPLCKECRRAERLSPETRETEELLAQGRKRCLDCKEVKPLEDFDRLCTGTGGRKPRCQLCIDARHAQAVERFGSRRCARCGEVKDRSAFHSKRGPRDGLTEYCRVCRTETRRTPQRKAAHELLSQGLKKCSGCDQTKPLAQFYRSRTGLGGVEGACKNCCNARSNAWKAEHAAAWRAFCRAYQAAHRDTINAQHRAAYAANPERRLQKRVNQQRRRGKELQLPGYFTVEDVEAIYAAQEGRCFYCTDFLGDEYDIDHKIPVSRPGSSHWPHNLCVACSLCNVRKKDRTVDEYRIWLQECGLPTPF